MTVVTADSLLIDADWLCGGRLPDSSRGRMKMPRLAVGVAALLACPTEHGAPKNDGDIPPASEWRAKARDIHGHVSREGQQKKQ